MSTKQKSTPGKVKKAFEQKLESLSKKLTSGGKKAEKAKSPAREPRADKPEVVKEQTTKIKSTAGERPAVEKRASTGALSPFRIKSRQAKTKSLPTAAKEKAGELMSVKSLTDDQKLEQILATPPPSHEQTHKTVDARKTELTSKKIFHSDDYPAAANRVKRDDLMSRNAQSDIEGGRVLPERAQMEVDSSSETRTGAVLERNAQAVKRGGAAPRDQQDSSKTDERGGHRHEQTMPTRQESITNDDDKTQEVENGAQMVEVDKTQSEVAVAEDHSAEWLEEALGQLRSCRMSSAERLLHKTVTHMRELPDKDPEVYVKALNGLTDVYVRKAKKARYKPLEAQWWLLVSLTLLKEGINECKDADSDEEKLKKLYSKSSNSFQGLDRELLMRMYKLAMNERHRKQKEKDAKESTESSATPVSPLDETGLLDQKRDEDTAPPLEWLQTVIKYCSDRVEGGSQDDMDDEDDDDSVMTDENTPTLETPDQEDKNELDVDSLSSEGSKSPREFVKQESTRTRALIQQDSITCDDVNVQPSKPSSTIRRAFSFRSKKRSGTIHRSQSQRERPTTPEDSGQPNMNKRPSVPSLLPDTREEHRTRIVLLREKYKNKQRLSSSSSIQEEQARPPVTDKAVNITLAYAVSRLADFLFEKKELVLALFLYIRSFNMFRATEANAISDKHIAFMLKNMAQIKSEQGDPIGAIGFMERALIKFKQHYGGEEHPEIVDTLFKLGNLYMQKRWHGETVMDNMVMIVHNEINKDFLEDQVDFETGASDDFDDTASTVGSVDDLDLSDEDEQEGTYSIYAKEAFSFYEKVVKLVESGDVLDGNNHLQRSIIKMGDCCFMDNDFDKAIQYYERSMEMIKEHGAADLVTNAHVLNMIAVVHFIQKNYGIAAKMFNTANVLNQAVLGVDTTNFEIACVYSLWGITCWILKDMDKCLSPCILAHEIFTRLFVEHHHLLPMKRKWLVSQVTYILGCTFRELHFFSKATEYLDICRGNAVNSIQTNTSWIIRIHMAIGQCHVMQRDFETALTKYFYHCLELIRDARRLTPGLELLRIQNLETVVLIHRELNNWDLVVEYTEELLNNYTYSSSRYYREIVRTLDKLATIYIRRGELAKAARSYNEAIDTFTEYHGYLASEMGPIVAKLAFVYHIQSCGTESDEEKLELIDSAGEKFAKAFQLDASPFSGVLYLNFLCCFHKYGDAVSIVDKITYLVGDGPTSLELTERTLCVLPECIEVEFNMFPDTLLPITALGYYLAVVCYMNVDEMVFAHAYVKRLENESAKETESPSVNTVITGFAQLLVCEYDEAAATFGNLYTKRDNSSYLKAFWAACEQEIDMTQLFTCHSILRYLGVDIEEDEADTSSNDESKMEIENEAVDQSLEVVEEQPTTETEEQSTMETAEEEDEEKDEEWTVFEEYTVDEPPQIAYDMKRRLSTYKPEDEWKFMETYTMTEGEAKNVRVKRPSISSSSQDNKPLRRESVQEEDDEWRVLDSYTVVETIPQGEPVVEEEEEQWVTFEDYTEDTTDLYNQQNLWSSLGKKTESQIAAQHGERWENNNKAKSEVQETTTRYNTPTGEEARQKQTTLLSQNKTLADDSGVESQEFSESRGTLATTPEEAEDVEYEEEEVVVYEEYTEEYIIPSDQARTLHIPNS